MENKNKISIRPSPAEFTSSEKEPSQKKIGWLGASSIAIGGSATSFILLGFLIPQVNFFVLGTIAIPLFTLGMLVSLFAIPARLELISSNLKRSGGVTAASVVMFRPYGEILANLAGTCYWLGRIPLCSMSALICAYLLNQWFFPNISLQTLSIGIVLIATLITLRGIKSC